MDCGEEMDLFDQKGNPHSNKIDEETPKKDYCGDNYIHADRFFLVASPLIFLGFNLIYWFSYGSQFYLAELNMEDDEQSG